MRAFCLATAVTLSTVALSAQAVSPLRPLRPGERVVTFMAYGPGSTSCGSWLDAARRHDESKRHHLQTWVSGFLTAMSSIRTLRETDWHGIAAWVDTYCAAHPLHLMTGAAQSLVNELGGH
jgi:hypothetical protein